MCLCVFFHRAMFCYTLRRFVTFLFLYNLCSYFCLFCLFSDAFFLVHIFLPFFLVEAKQKWKRIKYIQNKMITGRSHFLLHFAFNFRWNFFYRFIFSFIYSIVFFCAVSLLCFFSLFFWWHFGCDILLILNSRVCCSTTTTPSTAIEMFLKLNMKRKPLATTPTEKKHCDSKR